MGFAQSSSAKEVSEKGELMVVAGGVEFGDKQGLVVDEFLWRHIGPRPGEIQRMLKVLGFDDIEKFTEAVLPEQIRMRAPFALSRFADALSEQEVLIRAKELADRNERKRSFIGMGYYGTVTPPVILRNVLENPGWYTQYTPYQPEISQGRLEALLNYQTVVSELTGLPVANSSLLDEGTAAAEAMTLSYAVVSKKRKKGDLERNKFFVSNTCHPQTIDIIDTRAVALGIEVVKGTPGEFAFTEEFFGAVLQYPDTYGSIEDVRPVIEGAQEKGVLVTLASDLLALALIESPGALGADIAVGSAQRFGVPMGYGGPHAAFFATKDEYKRLIPGRLVGVSKDSEGRAALRLALQTREQHIRREKATSNICTAQVLLAVMAGMYAVYHGEEGLKRIAGRVHSLSGLLAAGLKLLGVELRSDTYFDTIVAVVPGKAVDVMGRASDRGINLRQIGEGEIGISLDESCSEQDVEDLLEVFSQRKPGSGKELLQQVTTAPDAEAGIPTNLRRSSGFLQQQTFQAYHSETEFLRYVRRLESRDLSLCQSMIPLGSCTMKLNATTEMIPVTWEGFGSLHPFVPQEQAEGYQELFQELEDALAEMTGFDAVSLQPNAGSQGEYAGLLAIRSYLEAKGEGSRKICLIPKSAHGTNPASAIMAGLKVVGVECDENGNIDVEDLQAKAEKHSPELAALMVTYPSTHGVFEEDIKKICETVHKQGGQVYLDGANLNALVGLSSVAEIGADVCHINLHKTFCIPHGGGGPGMGPIGVKSHLTDYLPGHTLVDLPGGRKEGAVSAAPWGSASILPISWAYIALMGAKGLRTASQVAILNANYIAKRLESHYPVLYRGKGGFVAHECILDLRDLKKTSGVEVEDVAKRLMDYGFHAPTISWPVPGTMMIEPTESESRAELDRFCDALIAIRGEICEIEEGKADRENNLLKNAPHSARAVATNEWNHPYSREQAAFATPEVQEWKFWPAVGRIDSGYGDRNLICTCPDVSELESAE